MPSQKRRLAQQQNVNQKVAKQNCSITSFFNKDSTRTDETTVVETPTPTSNQDEVTQPITPSKPNNSKTQDWLDTAWLTAFTWLLVVKEPNSSGDMTDVIKTWVDNGYRCLRRDKIKEHQDSDQHKDSLKQEVNHTVSDMTAKISSTAQKSIRDALKVLYFLISHNLPLDMFSSFIDLCIELGATNLGNLRLAKCASYTSWDIVQELLDILSKEVTSTVISDMQKSPSYSVMVDEVSDNRTIKHLAICARYINPAGEIQNSFVTDVELQNATAETLTRTITSELTNHQLNLQDMTGFASDGAAVFLGKKTGVDDTVEKLYKYYKYSCNHSASLKAVQIAFNQAPLTIKQAKHHRWLSHNQAVASIVRSYQAIVVDLETSNISSDPVGNGILKSLKDPTTLRCLLLLADTLPHLCTVSLLFQRRDVNLGMVKSTMDKTLKTLQIRKTQDGPWLLKGQQIAASINITTEPKADFNTKVRTPFLDQLIDNVTARFTDSDIIDQLSIIDLNGTDTLPSLYGFLLSCTLADHFSMQPEDLQTQWQDFLQLVDSMSTQERSVTQLLKLLHTSDCGLQEMYPLVHQLYAITATLPLSTAEVERVFSQVKIIKTSHRSNLKTTTLNRLLNIKLNCNSILFDTLLDKVTNQFFQKKDRRLLQFTQ
ncbi:unnamed protein product [Mytilus edulis]|uniref:DUF4371 domain-containing protein n=1 Tax=Mytilus edulis TaxID=6550 RepID=A0A8S3S692_MYTED|nr:unnamed protein product [Mytilus edulis]